MVPTFNIVLAACLMVAVLIGTSGGTASASNGYSPNLLAPGEIVPTTDPVDAVFVHGRIDADRYASAPVGQRDRSPPLWLAATATLTLTLAAMSPKRAAHAVVGVAIAWSMGLAVALARKPVIDRVAAADGSLWLIARRAGTVSIPIVDGTPWIPVVESQRHWATLAPRVVVDGEGHALLLLTMPAPGARVALDRR